jgi:hypothetical protein
LRSSGDRGCKPNDDRDHRQGGDPQKFHGIAFLHGQVPSSLVFLPFALREAQATVILGLLLRLALCLDLRSLAFIDG